MGSALISADKDIVRLIVVQLDLQQTFVFKLQQSNSEFQISKGRPDQRLVKIFPVYPESELIFFANDDKARMSIAVFKILSAPAGVRNFFDSTLVANGWKSAMPGGINGPGMTVYLKDSEIFCVLVDSVAGPAGNQIMLLHKQQKVK